MFAKSRISSRRNQMIAGVALLAGAFSFTLLRAAPATQPTGEEVIAKSIEATGGKAAYEKLKSRTMVGTLEAPTQRLHGTIEIYSKAPNLMYSIVEIPGVEKTEDGYDGNVAWEKSAMRGSRILEGDELALRKREADLSGELNWHKYFDSVTNDGLVDVDGVGCYKLTLTKKSGDKETRYYDAQTYLLVRADGETKVMGAAMHFTSKLSDYRDVGGIKVPFKTVLIQSINGMSGEIVLKYDKIEDNTDIPASRFAIPEDVKELLKDNATTQPSK